MFMFLFIFFPEQQQIVRLKRLSVACRSVRILQHIAFSQRFQEGCPPTRLFVGMLLLSD